MVTVMVMMMLLAMLMMKHTILVMTTSLGAYKYHDLCQKQNHYVYICYAPIHVCMKLLCTNYHEFASANQKKKR